MLNKHTDTSRAAVGQTTVAQGSKVCPGAAKAAVGLTRPGAVQAALDYRNVHDSSDCFRTQTQTQTRPGFAHVDRNVKSQHCLLWDKLVQGHDRLLQDRQYRDNTACYGTDTYYTGAALAAVGQLHPGKAQTAVEQTQPGRVKAAEGYKRP